MINIDTQIAYWRDGALEDMSAAEVLLESGKIRHGMFFAHLALEKALKAHVCHQTQELAPKIHNLLLLADLTDLELDERKRELLVEFNQYQLLGRYPESLGATPDAQAAHHDLQFAKEMLSWLIQQL